MPIRSVRSRPVAAGYRLPKDSGNRGNGTNLATLVARIEGEYGDSLRALHYIAVAIHNYHDSGNPTLCESLWLPSLRFLTGWDATNPQPPSPVSRQLPSPWRRTLNFSPRQPICALSSVTKSYESLARKGETMSTAEIAAYAYDQIDQARAELNAVSK